MLVDRQGNRMRAEWNLTLDLGGKKKNMVVRPLAEVEEVHRLALGSLIRDIEASL